MSHPVNDQIMDNIADDIANMSKDDCVKWISNNMTAEEIDKTFSSAFVSDYVTLQYYADIHFDAGSEDDIRFTCDLLEVVAKKKVEIILEEVEEV